MNSDQAGTSPSGPPGGWKKSRFLLSGLAFASFFGIALSALALASAALFEAPQSLKRLLSFCLGGASVSLFFFLSASFFSDILGVFFKFEKIKPLRLLGRLFLCLLGLVPLGLFWAALRIMRGFRA